MHEGILFLAALAMAAAGCLKWGAGRVSALLLAESGDDSDIKIAGEERAPKDADSAEEARELEIQRKNGNLDRARILGERLADRILDEDGCTDFGRDPAEDTAMRMQRRLLLAFTLHRGAESLIPGRILGHVAISSFYDALKRRDPEFYADIGESGSFSFYYLCTRRGGDTEKCIGRSFAMLAGKAGNHLVEDLGEALFLHFSDVVRDEIGSAGFKDE